MGILNLTPDSFYDGGVWKAENYLFHVEKMLEDGADILDVGGMSSRPGADFITEEEEIARVIEPIYQIKKSRSCNILLLLNFLILKLF